MGHGIRTRISYKGWQFHPHDAVGEHAPGVAPSTNQPITEVPRHSPDDVDRAVYRAEAE